MLLLIVGVAVGCGEGPPPMEPKVEDFQIFREPDGTQVVRGRLINTSERRIAGALLTVDLYEGPVSEDSRPVETMRVEVRDVDPNSERSFRQEVDSGRTLTGARVRTILAN